MLHIANKILQSSLVIYGASLINQVAAYPALAPMVEYERVWHSYGCRTSYTLGPVNSLYHLALQNTEFSVSNHPDYRAVNGLYYNQSLNIQPPLAKLAIHGVKAITGCILGKLITAGVWDSDASLGVTMVTSALCGGIVAAIAPKNCNIPYIKNLALDQFPRKYDIISSATAAGLLALILYEDTKDSTINEKISEYEDTKDSAINEEISEYEDTKDSTINEEISEYEEELYDSVFNDIE